MLNMSYGQFSFFLLVCFCQLSFSSSIPHLCHKDQSSALLKFKKTLTVDPSLVLCNFYYYTSSWNMSIDFCSWDGVIWDEMTGYVIELDLSCNSLVGKIDSNISLFQLSHLQSLDLSMNNFSYSHISPKFGRFSSLIHLNLRNSYFSGQIPSEIFHLYKLQSLLLSTSYDTVPKLATHDFRFLLQNLTLLRVLDLRGVSISSAITLNFSSHLTTLVLRKSELYGVIPESIFHLPKLEILDLSSNYKLSGYFPKTKWNSSASLIDLNLQGVNFCGNLPESLGYLTSLRTLFLVLCNIWGPIPESLSNLTRIEYLFLADNFLNGTIPSWIFSLPSLIDLELSNNHFSGQLEDIKSDSRLFIDLSNNQLQGNLPKSIQNLVNITNLDLSFNNFSRNVDVSFFSDFKHLSSLDLSYNSISLTNENNVNFSLPESLVYLQLAACEVKELEFLRSAKKLEDLDLSNNKLQGIFPDWASCNWMFSLRTLNLSHNMLTSMELIYLARNNLKGEIPQCLGNISGLEVLDMHHNSLTGTLPNTFRFRSSLRSLNLNGNKLEGKIPQSLANCKELQVVDLGDNHLIDIFPMWLGTLPKLQILSLRSNELHGSIRTPTIENIFPNLRMLDLSSNSFIENLPTGLFQHLKAMRTICQAMNAPSDGGDGYQDSVNIVTKGLEREVVRILFLYATIDFLNNKFEGHIPSIMGDLIALRMLNLSHNEFNHLVGVIPAQFSSLAVLYFSYNHLEGCIPQGNQFHTFDNNSYVGNDGLSGFPLSKVCGSDDNDTETNDTTSGLDDEEISE
uniref:Uncharacterized protein n=1 Tax=Solanum lycopersicum TaxID=4081 RepID=K4DI23_SOLLC